MRAVLESADDIVVVAEGGNGSEALQLVKEYAPDVLVLDINLPDKSGIPRIGRSAPGAYHEALHRARSRAGRDARRGSHNRKGSRLGCWSHEPRC